jgi:hypothetical protein
VAILAESLENKVKELQSGQNSMMKLLEKIYQAQLTTLSHQKLVSFFHYLFIIL